jgi:membrane dipeptidase
MANAAMTREAALAKAHALLDRLPLVDGHNDLPWVIRSDRAARGDVAAYDLTRSHQGGDTDIPRLRAGKLSAQFWAAFVPTHIAHATTEQLGLIDLIKRMNALHPEVFLAATRSSDIAKAKRQGKIASFIAVEGGVGLDNRIDMLRIYHALGVRYMTLCHNETLDWVDSATDRPRHNGITAFGRAVIAEMNRLGMLVDLSHASAEAQRQVLDVTKAPVAITHANAFSLCNHPRNVVDDVLLRLKPNGGIVMATFVPTFINQRTFDWIKPLQDGLGKAPGGIDMPAAIEARGSRAGPWPRADIDGLCAHIDYMADTAGIAHIGIGSDFYGGPTPDGLEDVSRFPDLIAALVQRGWSDDAVAAIASRNFVRVLRAVERIGRELAHTEQPQIGRMEDGRDG